jgi:CheY-like chemotaxis protein
MFYQVDSAKEWSDGGLGIGLSLVLRLIEMHGGSVTARSDGAGRGSEFTVRLPIVVAEMAVETAKSKKAHAKPRTTCRVLVVDDNRDAAISLAMLLKISGCETQTAHDGLEAVEMAGTFGPDVVLLDIGLPRLNGYDAARKIRQQPWGKDMVLVALTGWGQDDDRRMSEEAGFNHHMVKPVDYNALVDLLAALKPTPV